MLTYNRETSYSNLLPRERNSKIFFNPESIEWFIEDHAFLPSYDLAPSSPTFPDTKKDRKRDNFAGGGAW